MSHRLFVKSPAPRVAKSSRSTRCLSSFKCVLTGKAPSSHHNGAVRIARPCCARGLWLSSGRTLERITGRRYGMKQICRAGLVLASAVAAGCASTVETGSRPYRADQVESKNMRLVGYSDLQARSAYQPVIHHQGNRWIAYIGHHGGTREVPKPFNPMTKQNEDNGTSVVDVTDPKNPR